MGLSEDANYPQKRPSLAAKELQVSPQMWLLQAARLPISACQRTSELVARDWKSTKVGMAPHLAPNASGFTSP